LITPFDTAAILEAPFAAKAKLLTMPTTKGTRKQVRRIPLFRIFILVERIIVHSIFAQTVWTVADCHTCPSVDNIMEAQRRLTAQ
jgi:hypothetical protein